MNRRVLGMLLAVVLATVGTFVLVNYVRTAEERALAGEETVEILVVREEIHQGTPVEDIGERVGTERVPMKVRAADGIASLDDVQGRVAAVDLVPGEQVIAARFVQAAVLEEQNEIDIPAGLQLLTVPVDQTRSVGGDLRPGDTVGVIGSFKEVPESEDAPESEDIAEQDGPTGDTTGFVLHKVLVTRVQTDARTGAGSGAAPSLGGGGGQQADDAAVAEDDPVDDTPPGQFLVTLAVEAADAEKVVFIVEHGTLWLTSEPEDATTGGTRVQTKETIYE